METPEFLEIWFDSLCRATYQGSFFLLFVWCFVKLFPALSSSSQAWLWRFVLIKFMLIFVWNTPIEIPILQAEQSALEMIQKGNSFNSRVPHPEPLDPLALRVREGPATLKEGVKGVWGSNRVRVGL